MRGPEARPAPALRLRIGRRLSVEVKGVEQFLLVDDVVTVEDGAARVPGQAHGDLLGHVGAGRPAGSYETVKRFVRPLREMQLYAAVRLCCNFGRRRLVI